MSPVELSFTFGFTCCSDTSGHPTALCFPSSSCAQICHVLPKSQAAHWTTVCRGTWGNDTAAVPRQSQEGCVGCRCAAGTHSHTQSLTLCSSSTALVFLAVHTAWMCSFRQQCGGDFESVAFTKCYLIELISGRCCKINLNWHDGYELWKETIQKIILKGPQSLRKHCSRDLKPELRCSIEQWCGHSSYLYLSPQDAIHRHFHSTWALVGTVVATLHVELSSQ